MKDNDERKHPKTLALILLLLAFISLLWLLNSCKAGYKGPGNKSWVTTTPYNLIAEIPSLELPKPDTTKLRRYPKDRRNMVKMPLHTIKKSELTKEQIRKWVKDND